MQCLLWFPFKVKTEKKSEEEGRGSSSTWEGFTMCAQGQTQGEEKAFYQSVNLDICD